MPRRHDWLVGQLPVGMLDDSFFVRFTSLFQDVATSFLAGADNVPNLVDADVTPVPFIAWLGSWLGIHSIDSSMDEELQRRLLHQASQGLAWRGTRRGLEQFLEVITGGEVSVQENGGIFREGQAGERPPFVRVWVESIGTLAVSDFVALVADEIPANATYELYHQNRRLWPPSDPVPPTPTRALPTTGRAGRPDSEGWDQAPPPPPPPAPGRPEQGEEPAP